jgi:hypothetical protein
MPNSSISCFDPDPEGLLDLELDRKAVAVPAGPPGHVVALHRLEARERVLERARLDVVDAGHPVRGRRALVEVPAGTVDGLDQAAAEGVRGGPVGQHLTVQGGQVDARVQRLVHLTTLREPATLAPPD